MALGAAALGLVMVVGPTDAQTTTTATSTPPTSAPTTTVPPSTTTRPPVTTAAPTTAAPPTTEAEEPPASTAPPTTRRVTTTTAVPRTSTTVRATTTSSSTTIPATTTTRPFTVTSSTLPPTNTGNETETRIDRIVRLLFGVAGLSALIGVAYAWHTSPRRRVRAAEKRAARAAQRLDDAVAASFVGTAVASEDLLDAGRRAGGPAAPDTSGTGDAPAGGAADDDPSSVRNPRPRPRPRPSDVPWE